MGATKERSMNDFENTTVRRLRGIPESDFGFVATLAEARGEDIFACADDRADYEAYLSSLDGQAYEGRDPFFTPDIGEEDIPF
jgi:hypothetical protein